MLAPAPGLLIAERYRLDTKLGEGGMGSVWAAQDEKLRRQVAVKLVTERISDSARVLGRFEREAMAVARLRSPYIAQVYDYGVEDGSPYIIMELLAGEDLKALLARETRLSLEDTARIVVQISKALHAAHASGIVHRDLKPANVFIADDHGEQICKVFDFGVAKALNDLADDGDTTAEGVLLGTPRYMSPEQAHGAKQVDHRTDLWSLGVMAYLCVTGQLPFIASGTGHILVKVCTEEPAKPSELVLYLPKAVDAFFDKALAKDPDARFQNAKALGTAFAELAEVSLSAFSLSSSAGERLWTGISGSYPDTSRDGIAPDPAVRLSDGTLGAATKSPMAPGLGSRGVLVGAAIAATLAIAALVGVALTRNQQGAVPVPAAVEPSVSVAPSPVPPVPPELPSAEPASQVASAEASSAPEKPAPRVARGKRPAPDTTPASKPDAKPEAKPEPKSKDGLDLFNGRF